MKTEFTFMELSKIFAKVAKIEDAAKEETMFRDAYKEKDRAFQEAFAYNGHTFMGCAKDLEVKFEEKMSLSKAVDDASKRTHKLVKEYVAMFAAEDGCDVAYSDEDYVKEYITRKYAYSIMGVVYKCKSIARRAALRVKD